jgi:predicted RNase H-like nuclease (RuvC/YqgF family)
MVYNIYMMKLIGYLKGCCIRMTTEELLKENKKLKFVNAMHQKQAEKKDKEIEKIKCAFSKEIKELHSVIYRLKQENKWHNQRVNELKNKIC